LDRGSSHLKVYTNISAVADHFKAVGAHVDHRRKISHTQMCMRTIRRNIIPVTKVTITTCVLGTSLKHCRPRSYGNNYFTYFPLKVNQRRQFYHRHIWMCFIHQLSDTIFAILFLPKPPACHLWSADHILRNITLHNTVDTTQKDEVIYPCLVWDSNR
jgi:hypothetical protein